MVYSRSAQIKMPNNPEMSLIDRLATSFQPIYFIATLLVIPLWKWIDSYFSYKKERDRDFIKSAAKEGIKEEMREVNIKLDGMKDDIEALRKQAEQDRKETNSQFLQIIREQRK